MGIHDGTITCLQFHADKFLISGSADSQIIIWRCKDWVALHKLQIMNKSPVISLSLHKSGKILLALYDNGVLRLWNMEEARCRSKKKMGVVEVAKQEDVEEDADLEVEVKTMADLTDLERKPIEVKWEPSKGEIYAVLFNKMIQVYDISKSDEPSSQVIFDSNVTGFDFIGEDKIAIGDVNGDISVL